MTPYGPHSELYRSPSRSSDNPIFRTVEFWRRAGSIYLGYKLAQSQAHILRWKGMTEQEIKEQHWMPHNEKSGRLMYGLCVDLRGFFLKVIPLPCVCCHVTWTHATRRLRHSEILLRCLYAILATKPPEAHKSAQAGQFIGARSDFVPEGVCMHLRKLQDEVPPMPPSETEAILKQELQVDTLSTVFEWIDLEKPLGSASIAQVHKAKLRRYVQYPSLLRRFLGAPIHWWLRFSRMTSHPDGSACFVDKLFPAKIQASACHAGSVVGLPSRSLDLPVHVVKSGETAWSISNVHGVPLEDVIAANKSLDIHALHPGDSVRLPASCQVDQSMF